MSYSHERLNPKEGAIGLELNLAAFQVLLYIHYIF